MFLKNAWYIGAQSDELGLEPLARLILGEPVVLYRKQNGGPVALEDRCCHRRAPLSKGKVEGDSLRCGYHGFLYEPGGRCTWVPGSERLPSKAAVRAYPAVERHGWVWVWTGEAEADAALIPDFHHNDSPGWAAVRGNLEVKGGYLLLVENLLDLSHLPYVHIATIGAVEDTHAELVWERQDGLVRGTRVSRGLSPSTSQREAGIDYKTDQTQIMTFLPPTHILIEINRLESNPAPGKEPRVASHFMILNSMTPETETSCRYYWVNARTFRLDDAKLSAMMQKVVSTAFDEDKRIIEAQQGIIDLDPGAPMVSVGGDAGGAAALRLVSRLIEAERAKERSGTPALA
jgi:phenylpropionate dioxygenase-like ring-hydroxylating dioxygenase large terminal subunit